MERRKFFSSSHSKEKQPKGYWIHINREAMACRFEITLPSTEEAHIGIAQDSLHEIDKLEDQLTIFRDSSEVSYINRNAALEEVEVKENLYRLLSLAESIYYQTDGTFDITAGPLAKCWGFTRRAGRIPERDELQEAQSVVGMKNLLLNAERKSVKYLRSGMEINLGSIGKGYALDSIAETLRKEGVRTALLSAGGSSILALGDSGNKDGWIVGVRHPYHKDRRLAVLHLRNCAMATSGTEEQFFELNGKRYGHIIDPRTGFPAEGVISVTVVAQSAAVADALATAFYVGGAELAERYCLAHPNTLVLILEEKNTERPLIFGAHSRCKVEIV
jgi:FAD:protein FMN transferase